MIRDFNKSDKMTEKITLNVAEAFHKDVVGGFIRFDEEFMQKLGVSSGDIIEIEGKEKTYARAWRGAKSDVGKNIARINANIRNNAKVEIYDNITINKAVVKDANLVELMPLKSVKIRRGEHYIRKILKDTPVYQKQHIVIEGEKDSLKFVVLSTNPSGPVVVTRDTKIVITNEHTDEIDTFENVTYKDVGGLKNEIKMIRDIIELPLYHPELANKLNISPLKSILLYGPSGIGKSYLARAVINEMNVNALVLSYSEFTSIYYGESEERLRKVFEEAEKDSPAIIFIDNIDGIGSRENLAGDSVERRMILQLFDLLDTLQNMENVFFIAATNKPELLDSGFRRSGRFDREIELPIPDVEARFEILLIHTKNMSLSKDVNLKKLAEAIDGYVGADIKKLTTEAAIHAINRTLPKNNFDVSKEILDKIQITVPDFEEAMKNIKLSQVRVD